MSDSSLVATFENNLANYQLNLPDQIPRIKRHPL